MHNVKASLAKVRQSIINYVLFIGQWWSDVKEAADFSWRGSATALEAVRTFPTMYKMARNADAISEALDQIESQLARVEHHFREELKEMSGSSRVRLYDQAVLFSQKYGESRGGEIDFEWLHKESDDPEQFDLLLSFFLMAAHLSLPTDVHLNTEAISRLIQRIY